MAESDTIEKVFDYAEERRRKMKLGYDNDKYIRTQSAHIRERIAQFGGKLYLEFGGKLYDDNHASRVLPGFQPDSKLRSASPPRYRHSGWLGQWLKVIE